MKSVLHVITSTDLGGAQTMLYRLLLGGSTAERAIVVSLLKAGPIGDWLNDLGVEVRSLKMRKSITDAAALPHLSLLIRRARPDIVVSWLYHADLMATLAKMLGGEWPLLWNLRGSSPILSGQCQTRSHHPP